MARSPLVSILPKKRRAPGGLSVKYHDFTVSPPFYDRAYLPRTLASYDGDGLNSNVITAPVLWIMRTFTEAVAIVERRKPDGFWERALDHPGEILIDRPNDAYDADALWKATCISYTLDGNAYWLKERNPIGDVIRLWYVSHNLVRPKRDPGSRNFIDYYDYTPDVAGRPERIPPRDIIHFRLGLDPRDPMYGFSPLKALLREVGIDEEAQRFTGDLLVNNAVPGLIISPSSTGGVRLTPDQTKEVRQEVNEKTSGSNRGATMAFGIPMDAKEYGLDPNKMMLGNLRDITEERVCAVLGIPAAVVGFGSGLQSTKVGATMREMINQAQNDCIVPMQKTQAKQLTAQLLPDFVGQPRRFRYRFDRTDVSRFQEEMNLRADYAGNLLSRGSITVRESREMCGLDPGVNTDVYYVPTNVVLAGPDAAKIKTFPTAPPPKAPEVPGDRGGENDEGNLPAPLAARMNGANGNGNGRESDDGE